MTTLSVELVGLRRVRWAVRATLAVGVAASVSANVLHAARNPISQVIAGWPPVALMLTVELISRVPTHRPLLTVVRMAATTVIAAIAAWVSYWHMASVAARFGETGASAYLLPISVDGLVVVASVCLVEIAGRLRTTTSPSKSRSAEIATQHSGQSAVVSGDVVQPEAPAASGTKQLVPVSADAFTRANLRGGPQ
jgi:hypothetical protein